MGWAHGVEIGRPLPGCERRAVSDAHTARIKIGFKCVFRIGLAPLRFGGRLRVLAALTKKFTLEPALRGEDGDCDAARVKRGKKPGSDGCADAWMRAAKRTLSGSSSSSSSEGGSSNAAVVVVCGVDFADAMSELTPSLTDQDVAHYLRLRESFEGGRK